ncbi:MAG TPA: hypothetical protein VG672_24540 [Bryobacteraceae bacterium]|jgi:hypothetical protein|nr:hypothetical protein [Bryobacteraceae bacterium]
MKDWKQIASGIGLDIPEADLTRIASTLDGLEAAFRPLTREIPSSVEPAVIFRAEGGGE